MFGIENATAEQRKVTSRPRTVFELRDAAGMARIYKDRLDAANLSISDGDRAGREAGDLLGEISTLEKAIKKMDAPDEKAERKLDDLKFRLATARDNEAKNARISAARKVQLDAWLAEGNPTNKELIARDRASSDALR
jgi:hypothetical protein